MLVVFDVDGTLLKGDSLFLAARHSRSIFEFIISSIIFSPYFIFWKLRLISDENLKEEFIRCFKICEKFNKEEKSGNKNWFLKILNTNLRNEAIERLNFHKKNGDEILLCSASLNMLLSPFAEFLEVELISTKLIRRNGLWLPLISGKNCKGINKLNQLRNLKGPNENLEYEAYGNSFGDKELLDNALIPHYRDFSKQVKNYPIFPFKTLLIIMGLTFFCYGVFSAFNKINVFYYLKNSYSIIIKGIFIILLGYFIRFIRWRLILKKLGIKIPIVDDILVWMGSYTFTATPGKIGEGIRAILLKKIFGISFSETFAAIIFERIIDGLSVFIIVFINFKIIKNLEFLKELNFLRNLDNLYPFVIFLFLMIFVFKKKIKRIFKDLLNYHLINNSKELIISLRTLFSWKLFLMALPLGMLSWGLEGLSLWLLIKDISNLNISLMESTVAHTTSGAIGVLSMLPGGVGSTEFTLNSFLSFQGLSQNISTSVTILIRLMTIWFATFLGILCLMISRFKIKK